MTGESRFTMRPATTVLMAVALLLAGAGATYWAMRDQSPTGQAAWESRSFSLPGQPAAQNAHSDLPRPEVVVALSQEAIQRAGLVVSAVESARPTTGLRVPGLTQPNAYKQVVVTPLVSGRVTRITAELGQQVRRGQTIAQIFSPEVADAQSRYVSAQAMLDAHERELARVQTLADIGAASRQELERIHAEHDAQTVAVRSARTQLELLGVQTPDAAAPAVNSSVDVAAPLDGVVVERGANVGLNVDPATKLFAIVDLSTLWVVADVYERDLPRIHLGSDTTVEAPGYPDLILRGHVDYIDPQVNSDTRTARLRVEVPNPRGVLRLGMYVDVVIASSTPAAVPVVPRSAVQNVGDRLVVYATDPARPDTFIEREVLLGSTIGDAVVVISGVKPGDSIVTHGSFFLRAERERLGLRPAEHPAAGSSQGTGTAESPVGDRTQTVRIAVNEGGFDPPRTVVRAGVPVHLVFVRTAETTCATDVVLPSLNIRRTLPLHTPVTVELAPAGAGEIALTCGAGMFKGTIVVE